MAAAEDSTGSPGANPVSESLEGLVGALDKLKASLGYGDEFALVEQHIAELQQENEELRQFAETAIVEAQRLKDMNEELSEMLGQRKLEKSMAGVLSEAAKLRDVADEFERDLIEDKMAEMEAKNFEIVALKERVQELEDENEGLTQTLNEFRQTTQQLQRLQSHEVRRLQLVEKVGGRRGPPSKSGSTGVLRIPEGGASEDGGAPRSDGTASPRGAASSGGTPRSGPSRTSTPRAGGGAAAAAAAAAVGVAAGVAAFGGSRGAAPGPAAAGEAQHIAEQLEEVAAGDDGGLLADAARVLRELGDAEAALAAERAEAERLRAQVAELNDTMFSKTFKPPSAWAEREIKYKTDKKAWEEQRKELQERIASLAAQVDGLKGASGAIQLEQRIQDLEASLLQSEREKDNLRAQLHETQLSMRNSTGEFGNAGVRLSPLRPIGTSEGSRQGEVHELVHQLEAAHVGMHTPRGTSAADAAHRQAALEARLAQAEAERAALAQRLAELRPVALPPALHATLGACAPAAVVERRVEALEHDLEEADAEAEELARELRELQAAMLGLQVEETADSVLEAAAAAAAAAALPREPAALAERAQQEAAALQAQLEAAEWRNRELADALEEIKPVRLHIQAEAAERPAEVVSVPFVLREAVGGDQAPAAAVEAAAAEMAARAAGAKEATAGAADRLQQVQQLAAWLEQAEADKAALTRQLEDLRPVQLRINAAVEEAERAAEAAEERLVSLTIAVPPSLHETLGERPTAAAVIAAAGQLEQASEAAEAESEALAEQLQQVLLVQTVLHAQEEAREAAEEELAALQAATRQPEAPAAAGTAAPPPPRVSVSVGGRQQDLALEEAERQAAVLQAKLLSLRQSELGLQSELTRAHRLQLQLRQADAEKRSLQSELRALEPSGAALPAVDSGSEAPPVDEADKAAAIAQLREELRKAEAAAASLREQLHRQATEAPVRLGIAVQDAPATATEAVRLGISVRDAPAPAPAPETVRFGISVQEPAEAPVRLSVSVGGETLSAAAAAERAAALEGRLRQAEAERAALRAQLDELRPVRLQLAVDGGGAAASPALSSAAPRRSLDGGGTASAGGLSPGSLRLAELSESSMIYSPEQASALARDRAEADAAYDAHLKNSDLPALRRAKAKLETRCHMLEAQVAKMGSALAQADSDKAEVEAGIDVAVATGDVAMLHGLKDRLRPSAAGGACGAAAASASAGGGAGTGGGGPLDKSLKRMGTMFKNVRGKDKGGQLSKESLKAALHETQEALAASEQERNVLKRQLAKLSKKYQQAAVSAAHMAGIVAGAQAASGGAGPPAEENGHGGDGGSSEGGADLASLTIDDNEVELLKLREENQMLMEHLVMNKVRLAETEGDYLESKRALLRAREKQLALVKKINELRQAWEAGDAAPASPLVAGAAAVGGGGGSPYTLPPTGAQASVQAADSRRSSGKGW